MQGKDETQQHSYSGQEQAQRLAERVTSQIEKVPQNTFLLGAALSVSAALMLRLAGRHQDALFVGQWAPTLLLVGLYSKRVTRGESRQEF